MHLGKAASNVIATAQARLESHTSRKLEQEKAKTKRVFISSSYFQFHLLFFMSHTRKDSFFFFFFFHNTFIKREIKNLNPTVIQSPGKK